MGNKKFFALAMTSLMLVFFLFSCRNISPEDLQKNDLKQIIDFLIEDKEKTEPHIDITSENESSSSEPEIEIPVPAEPDTAESSITSGEMPSEEDTELTSGEDETKETTEKILTPDVRVIEEYPEIPEQFSYVPIPDSLSFTNNIKEMISNLNGLAKRDFNKQRVYIATSKPELLTPNPQNNKQNDIKYYRNKLIDQKYNTELNSLYIKSEEESIYSTVSKSINSGEYFSDILCLPLGETLKLLYSGHLYNLRKTPFINFNAPYYNQTLISESKIKDSFYMLSSDFTFDPNELYAVYLNRDLCKEKNINEKINEYTNAGEWSLDAYLTILRDLEGNINAGGSVPVPEEGEEAVFTPPQEEFFAADFAGDDVLRVFLTSGGLKYYDYTENSPALAFNSEKDYNIIGKLKSLFKDYMSGFTSQGFSLAEEEPSPVEKFTSGNALFYISTLEHINSFTSLPFEWTLLPIPKSNPEDKYSGFPSMNSLVMSIPGSVANTELCGIMIEALSISSFNLLQDEYVNEKMLYNLRDISGVKTLREITNLNAINYANTFPLNDPSLSGSDKIYNSTAGYIRSIITGDADYETFTGSFEKSGVLLNEFFSIIGKNNNIY